MKGKSFSNILQQDIRVPAIAPDSRVQWVEESLGMFCSGQAVYAVSDCLGWPTRMYLVRVDKEFRDMVCITDQEKKSGCVYRHVTLHNMELEKAQEVSFW